MELLGVEVDRAKYRALVDQLQQQQRSREEAAAAAGAAGSGRVASRSARRAAGGDPPTSSRAQGKQREAREQNQALERFKFWLGLPNDYYKSEWRAVGDSAEAAEAAETEQEGEREAPLP